MVEQHVLTHTIRRVHDMNVIEKREQALVIMELGLQSCKAGCCPRANRAGMRVALFTTFCLGDGVDGHTGPPTDVSGRQSSRVTKAPVGEVAQGVQVHGVVVRHGEKQEKKEGEVEQEVEGEKEENTQGRRHMCMDGMEVKRQMRSALSQCEM